VGVDDSHVNAVGALVDPTRRRVYEFVAGAAERVGRDEVAGALGMGRTLAAFHLDKLAEVGLLQVAFARPAGRSGPGAGRPAKLYRAADADVSVEVPPRAYPALAVLLAEALDRASADAVAYDAARAAGVAAGRAVAGSDPVGALAARGYAPVARDGAVELRNCPFHAVAREFPPLVCGMNLALLAGMVEGAGWPCVAVLDSAPGRCCVSLASKTNN
jgi:predicted ArsR family transcriptional regulator